MSRLQVHGVLRNLKLEPPKLDLEEVNARAGSAAEKEKNGSPASAPPRPSALSQDESEDSLPASLGRLGVRDDGDDDDGPGLAGAEAATTPSPPRYTWFSLYDEQGVGGRRNSALRAGSGGSAGSGNARGFGSDAGGNSNDDKSVGTPKGSSGKAEGSWRWGWGRKGSGASLTPKTASMTTPESGAGAAVEAAVGSAADTSVAEEMPVTASGGRATPDDSSVVPGDGIGGEEETQQELKVLSTFRGLSSGGLEEEETAAAVAAASAASVAGRRLAESVERERKRLRRKDIYSYFMMPLVRALEAQMGTAAWLRKVGRASTLDSRCG